MKQLFIEYFKQFGINEEVRHLEILSQLKENPRMAMIIGWFGLLPELFDDKVLLFYKLEIVDCAKVYRILERDVFLKHPILMPYMAHVKSTINTINPPIISVSNISAKVDALANVMWFNRLKSAV